jgi:hypothetical protein
LDQRACFPVQFKLDIEAYQLKEASAMSDSSRFLSFSNSKSTRVRAFLRHKQDSTRHIRSRDSTQSRM